MLLWQVFFEQWDSLPNWLHLYLNVGTVIGGLALASYLAKAKLPTAFYTFSLYVYGSGTILVLVVGMTQAWSPWR
jgi:hypothetical protein